MPLPCVVWHHYLSSQCCQILDHQGIHPNVIAITPAKSERDRLKGIVLLAHFLDAPGVPENDIKAIAILPCTIFFLDDQPELRLGPSMSQRQVLFFIEHGHNRLSSFIILNPSFTSPLPLTKPQNSTSFPHPSASQTPSAPQSSSLPFAYPSPSSSYPLTSTASPRNAQSLCP